MGNASRSFGHIAKASCDNIIYFDETLRLAMYAEQKAEYERRIEAEDHGFAWRTSELASNPYFRVFDRGEEYPDMPHLRLVGEFDPDWAA